MEEIKIETEFIKLEQLLKYVNIVSSGGIAKEIIQDGEVYVNGEVETRRGTHLKGGTVSGHSAIAFCLAMIIIFLSQNSLVTVLALLLALLVSESRVEAKIHYLSDVIFGAILGTLIATLLFKVIFII